MGEEAQGVDSQSLLAAVADVTGNISEVMARAMDGGFGSEVTVILAAIGILLAVGLSICPFRPAFSPIFSGLMISLGILGTFYGIFGAIDASEDKLSSVKSDEMQEGVKLLLSEMKVAFVSSLFGLGGAILFRILLLPLRLAVSVLYPPPPPSPHPKVTDALESIRRALIGDSKAILAEQVQKLHGDLGAKIDAVKQAVSGDGDSNLVEQMEEFRRENSGWHSKLHGIADAIKASAASMEQLLERSRAEISAIGTKMDNFHQANIAEHGKMQSVVQAISVSAANAAQLLEKNHAHLSLLEQHSKATSASLQELIVVNREGFNSLDGLTETIRENLIGLLKKLIEDLSTIIGDQLKKQLDELIRQIDETINNRFSTSIDEFKSAVSKLNEWQEEHCKRVKGLTDDFKATKDAFVTTKEGIVDIQAACAKIPQTMRELKTAVDGGNSQLTQLNREMDKFKKKLDDARADLTAAAAALGEAAQASVNLQAQIEADMKEIVERVTQGNTEFKKQMLDIASKWGESMIAIAEKCDGIITAVGGKDAKR